MQTGPDLHSFANIDHVQTKHLHLDLKVDFTRKSLVGVVTLSLKALQQVDTIVLDTRHLTIKEARHESQVVKHELLQGNEAFGTPLSIQLNGPVAQGTEFKLVVDYETSEQAPALQWLSAEQTVGKEHPYLFTQCQAIHARSLVPHQDTPGVKITYSASISVPQPLTALMSSLSTGQSVNDQGWNVFTFDQKTTMPSYLIALVVGHLESRDIGPRSRVWSEPQVVEAAAWEFVDTEKFIATGESLLTPYDWGRYDLLVLPASFPYGGMENPCLTFVTPTLLAGDRSMVDVVAHEIAHSWMGNLVTTKTWEHFWLNEGWTVFVERKITGRLHGESQRQFSSILGLKALKDSVDFFGKDNPLTALRPNMQGIDPDDSFSSVPYEKGFNLLYLIETLVGGAEVFEPYMKAYVVEFAGKSLTTEDWKSFLYTYMKEHHGQEKVDALNTINWDEWFTAPGMDMVKNEFDRTLAEACDALAKRWDEARGADRLEFSKDDVATFTPEQKVVFLTKLEEYPTLPHAKLAAMDTLYGLSATRNSEIRFHWHSLCLVAAYEPIYPQVVTFLGEQGRMKYVRPLYRALNKVQPDLAKETFAQFKATYHPIASRLIEKDLSA